MADHGIVTEASELARKLADAHMAGGANLYQFVANALLNEQRLKALRVQLDCDGKAVFSVWANEMIELEGLWEDESEAIPAMFETLDELLDCLWEVLSTPIEDKETPLSERGPSDA